MYGCITVSVSSSSRKILSKFHVNGPKYLTVYNSRKFLDRHRYFNCNMYYYLSWQFLGPALTIVKHMKYKLFPSSHTQSSVLKCILYVRPSSKYNLKIWYKFVLQIVKLKIAIEINSKILKKKKKTTDTDLPCSDH